MLAGPIVEPLLDAATCSEQGPRRYNADGAAYYRSLRTGMVAVAVADGVGDSPEASWAAHTGRWPRCCSTNPVCSAGSRRARLPLRR